jgi:tetratricopeptide (TPR) repeat protein
MRTFATAGLALALLAASSSVPAHAQSAALRETFGRGMELYRAGRYAEAEPFWREAVGQAEREFGPNDPRLANGLDHLAGLYKGLGRYAEAEPLYRRGLAIYEQALGPDHPHMAAALNNLALLYRLERRYAEAEPLFRRSLAIEAHLPGTPRPEAAQGLDNLAGMYEEQGRYAEAEPLYGRALAMLERALGPDHPEVATALNNLAGRRTRQGRYAEAEPLYKRAIAIDEKALGPGHPTVARLRDNLATMYEGQGRHAETKVEALRRSPGQARTGTGAAPAGYKRVTLDALVNHGLVRPVPLAMAIPTNYALVDPGPGYVWADPGEHERVRATRSMPTTGSFWARLTPNTGYDPARDRFVCGPDCTEADMPRQLESSGVTGVAMERQTVGGVPVLLVEATPLPPAAGKTPRVYMAYVAVGVDTNVLLISYRPPANGEAEGERVWETFKRSLSEP